VRRDTRTKIKLRYLAHALGVIWNELMKDIYKYLYALSAACFIGVGSGLVTFLPYVFDYEAKAVKSANELEQEMGSDYSKNTDCHKFKNLYAKCEYTKYLLKTVKIMVRFFELIVYILLFLGFFSFLLGLYCHWKNDEQKTSI
jgi:ribonucleotide reductase alpha subunit